MTDETTDAPRDWDLVVTDFEAVVRKYDRWLRYIVLRHGQFLLGYADVEEIVDETWCHVRQRVRAGRFDTSIAFHLWLRGICLNALKSKHFRPSGPSILAADSDGDRCLAGPPSEVEAPDEAAERDELLLALRECLAMRSEREQKLYEWVYVEGRTKVAAARELGCSEAYVRQKLLPRLHQALARCLARKGFRA